MVEERLRPVVDVGEAPVGIEREERLADGGQDAVELLTGGALGAQRGLELGLGF